MKKIKRVQSFVVPIVLAIMNITPIYADSPSAITPYDVGCNPYYSYTVDYRNYDLVWGSTVEANNSTSSEQTMTVFTSRTTGSTFTVSAQAEIRNIISAVSLSAEYAYLNTVIRTEIQNILVPANTTVYAHSGTKRVSGYVSKYYINNSCDRSLVYQSWYDYGYSMVFEWWQ